MVSNKRRILKVKEIFFNETDENNELTYEGLIQRLEQEYGKDFNVGIRAIRDDIKELSISDTYLIERQDKIGKKYFSQQNRVFETNELRTLIDAISSAKSIDPSHKDRLINKIKKFTSRGLAKSLTNQIFMDPKVVTEEKTLRYCIDAIHNAIHNNKKIRFKYGRYNLDKVFVINDKDYEVSPYALVWDNGFYYLVAYNEEMEEVVNYRVDRIRNVVELKKTVENDDFDLRKHFDSCFNMYPGEVLEIKIKFDNHLINAIIDRFGKDLTIEIYDENKFILITEAALSTGLVRWILNWGSDAKVLSPPKLIDKIREEVKRMNSLYDI